MTPVALMQSLGAQLALSAWWTGLCSCCLWSQFLGISQPYRHYSRSPIRPAGLLLLPPPLYHTKMLYFEFFSASGSVRKCGVSLWWNYSWSTCFSFSLTGDIGQTWTYCICASVEGHLGLLLLRELSANSRHPNSFMWCVMPQFFLTSQQDLVENIKMHGDSRTTSDNERLMQLLHTWVLQMMIYFLWADATGKPANSN